MLPTSGTAQNFLCLSLSRLLSPAKQAHKVVFSICMVLFLLTCIAEVHAQAKPQRIVSTTPSTTETLFALGVGDRVVGVSRFCSFPPEVKKLPKVGSYITPNIEVIARLAPDLVVLEQGSNTAAERLHVLHIPSVEVPHGTLEDVFIAIQLIAKAVGAPERSAGLIAQIKNSLSSIESKARTLPSPRVLIIVDRKQGTLTDITAVGPNNYVNQILSIAGGKNLLEGPNVPQYPHISLETVLREDPDVIIDLSGTQESETEQQESRASTLALWGQYRNLTAVRNNHVYAGTTSSLVVPGPRTPVAAQRLFNFVHGIGGSD